MPVVNALIAGDENGRQLYPLMIRGSSIWWRGQIDFGFW